MGGKDKTVKAGKGKKALANEWNEAVSAADSGNRLTTSSSNTPKGGKGKLSAGDPGFDPDYAAKIALARGKSKR